MNIDGQTMTADLLESDTRARVEALQPASFIVEAPAGAGKTELLTQRLLKLLVTVEAPEEIIAITFTNKAAAQMQGRISVALRLAQANEQPTEPHRRLTYELAQAALAHGRRLGWGEITTRLAVYTIDALCLKLARQLPLLSRFGGAPQVAEDAQPHYQEAARRTLCLLDEGSDEQAECVAVALRYVDNDVERLNELLAAMLERRDQWLAHSFSLTERQAAETALAELVQLRLTQAQQALNPQRQRRLMPLARFAAANLNADSALAPLLDWNTELTDDLAQLPLWRALCALLLTAELSVRKTVTKTLGFPADKEQTSIERKAAMLALLAEFSDADEQALASLAQAPPLRYSDEEWQAVIALSSLLKLAAGELWQVFHAAGQVDFVEVAQRATAALGALEAQGPSDLALALDYRLRHLLVDEFQDTSPAQVALLRCLTAGWSAGDGRTLFAVGDPMQSIYRFRKADVGLFLAAAQTGIGDLPLTRLVLTRNNRSDPAIVSWINQRFAAILPPTDDIASGAISYRPFAPTRTAAASAGVFPHLLRVSDDAAAQEQEADAALALIQSLLTEPAPHQAGCDIAILTRSRAHVVSLAAALRAAHIPFQAVEIEKLGNRQAVQDLLTLYAALCQRADRVQWLALLRAPWCGLSLADLHTLAHDAPTAPLWQLVQEAPRLARLSLDGQTRVASVVAVLRDAYASQGRLRPRRWLEGVWLRLGGAAITSPEEQTEVKAALDLVDELAEAGRLNAENLALALAKLYAPPQGAARVQLMTLHKAKGLEFDTVILPGLHHTPPPDDSPLVIWEEITQTNGQTQLLAAPIQRRGALQANSLYQFLRRLEQQRAACEAARVLYVAATRAIRQLHWFAVLEERDGKLRQPKAGSFLKLLWPAEESAIAAAQLMTVAPRAQTAFTSQLVRLNAPLSVDLAALALAGRAPSISADLPTDSSGAQDALAAHVGTLVHGCLEVIAGEIEQWSRQRLNQLQPEFINWLRQRGHHETAAEEGAQRALAALITTVESADGRWLLSAHEAHTSEYALSLASGEGAVTRVIDRSFISEGARWIVDYKTVQVSEAASAAALAAHAERYRAQLTGYAALFADEGRPIKLAVFYARHGRLAVLP